MSLSHVETIKVSLNEDQLLKIVEKFLIDRYYNIKYQSFNLESAIFNFDDTGNIACEIIFQKKVKDQDFFEEI